MEEVSFLKPRSQALSNSAKPPPVPSPASKSGRSESSGNQTARVSEKSLVNAPSASPPQKDVSLAKANAAVDDINHQLEIAQHTLRFQIDDATDEIKVLVVDKETGKVIRTIPPEPSLSVLASGNFSGLFSVRG